MPEKIEPAEPSPGVSAILNPHRLDGLSERMVRGSFPAPEAHLPRAARDETEAMWLAAS